MMELLSSPLILASSSQLPVTIAIILTLGVGGQWLANRLRIPGVLLLLTSGILVGPVFNIIDPVEDFGTKTLFPVVSIAVGLLLYEGGLGLKLDRLNEGRSVILRLVTIGALVTWLIGWGATVVLFDVSTSSAALIGAILVVSGPTVVIPLLHLARPREPTGSILRWEGIVIDPVGATLAIVVLDATLNDNDPAEAALQIGITLGAGAVAGVVVAALALFALHRHWVPDHLLNPTMLAAAIVAFAAANSIAAEAGLMATTMLGLVLANQRLVPNHELTAFSEDVGYLILGTLFIVLGAMVNLDDLVGVLPRALILIAVLVLIARPVAVWLSTIGSGMQRNDRQFLAWMAPRGIVAASVATVFSQTLIDEGAGEVPELVPVVFATVIVTVALYGLSATWVARKTRVAKIQPNGIALVSNHRFAIDLADKLASHDIPVLVISTSTEVQRDTFARGLLAYERPIDSHDLDLTLDGVGIKQAILLTDDENFAALAAHHLSDHLGRANLYQVQPDADDDDFEIRGRVAFGDLTFQSLSSRSRVGGFQVMSAGDLGPDDMALFEITERQTANILNGAPAEDALVLAVTAEVDQHRRATDANN
ncbi:MAG: cation:proton antiporter [Acidimicrobiia bacterium]|nr:cation:proton antiporter [Acidimicrobiia bacterium]